MELGSSCCCSSCCSTSRCCKSFLGQERSVHDVMLKESSRFCPTQTWDAPSSELSAEQRLKRESVRFVVSFLDGLSDYIVDTVVSSTDSRLELSAKFSSAVSGEVATRSKLPLCFHVASSGEVRLSIGVTDHGTVRLELEPGSLSHAPVEGAVEASNRFFKDFTDKGGRLSGPPGQDRPYDHIAAAAMDWWEGRGQWEGHCHGDEYAMTKFWMIFMVLYGSRYSSAVTRLQFGTFLIGCLCGFPKEYTAFEWLIADDDNDVLMFCESHDIDEKGPLRSNFPNWREELGRQLAEATLLRPVDRKVAEKFCASSTNYFIMHSAKALGCRVARSDAICRLFSACKNPGTASQWDALAQHWQKTTDITYAASGNKEGRILWRPVESVTRSVAQQDSHRRLDFTLGSSLRSLASCCMFRPGCDFESGLATQVRPDSQTCSALQSCGSSSSTTSSRAGATAEDQVVHGKLAALVLVWEFTLGWPHKLLLTIVSAARTSFSHSKASNGIDRVKDVEKLAGQTLRVDSVVYVFLIALLVFVFSM